LTALAIGGLLAIAGCGSSGSSPSTHKKLDTYRVALAIQQTIATQRHLRSTVLCPTNIPQAKGVRFTCVATTYANPKKPIHTRFYVYEKDSRGDVHYASPR
jgi:hypothetical protein